MKTRFTIKNFRRFDSEGVTLDLKPITILTGTNSSGKSSVIKALVAMSSFWEKMTQEVNLKGKDPFKYYINFSDVKLDLGGFNNVLHFSENKDGFISFQYSVDIGRCGSRLIVEYRFVAQENDKANFGWLDRITIKDSEGSLLFQAEKNNPDYYFDLNLFKKAYSKCIRGRLAYNFSRIHTENYEELGITKEHAKWMKEEEIPSLNKEMSEFEQSLFEAYYETSFSAFRGNEDRLFPDDSYSFLNTGTFFPMPVWTVLEGVDINSVFSTVTNKCLETSGKEVPEDLASDLSVILRDCQDKGYSSLLEYFVSMEDSECMFNDTKRYGEEYMKRFKHDSIVGDPSFFGRIKGHIAVVRGEYYDFTHKGIAFPLFNDEERFPKDIDDYKIIEEPFYEVNRKESQKLLREDIHFKFVHDTLGKISELLDTSYHFTTTNEFGDHLLNKENHYYALFCSYVLACIKDSLIPNFSKVFHFIGSDRAPVKRLYSLRDDNDSFSTILKEYNNAVINFDRERSFKPGDFVNKWLNEFGIAESLEIENVVGGLGLVVYLKKKDGRKTILADDGYGVTQLLSVLLSIETSVLLHYRINKNTNVTIAVEEPEIHLHPDYQSLLTDMFLDAYKNYHIHFIIETHSEYLVRRCQVRVAESFTNIEDNPFGVFYIPKDNIPYEMLFTKDGFFETKFGTGFYDAAGSDAMTLSRLAKRHRNELL